MLSRHMEGRYRVATASNGAEALKMLAQDSFDVVVTDVMMPVMDGIELCRAIKSDASLCHVPVVMLTARTTVDDRIEGLDSGADAYVDKPFEMDYLTAQIDNLVENMSRLFKSFRHTPDLEMGEVPLNKMDEAFLEKATQVVLSHIEDNEYNIDNMADDMNMSRSSLHRKVKGVTGMTPGEFIRAIKLKKAAELLREGGLRVNEVCSLVGMRSLSYFSKSFQKMFGVLPKDFARK